MKVCKRTGVALLAMCIGLAACQPSGKGNPTDSRLRQLDDSIYVWGKQQDSVKSLDKPKRYKDSINWLLTNKIYQAGLEKQSLEPDEDQPQ